MKKIILIVNSILLVIGGILLPILLSLLNLIDSTNIVIYMFMSFFMIFGGVFAIGKIGNGELL